MGICTRRYFFLTICVLQMLTIIEKQVFDFLGFLWIPILLNFFQIIFIILGFFGAFQYRPKYIISYSVWHLLWLAWNVFIICLYLDVAGLNHKQNKVLKLDPYSRSSWWENGPGCKETLNKTAPIPIVEKVTDCWFDYRQVEIFQASLQGLLAVFGMVTGFCLSRMFLEEDDSSSRKAAAKTNKRMSLYSIEFSPQIEHRLGGDSDSQDYDPGQVPPPVSPKPMTPRRVKRRSVMQRGTTSRHSRRQHGSARASTRSSRRAVQNPVTRLLEQQQKIQASDSPHSPSPVESLPNYYSNASTANLTATAAPNNWQSNGHANPTYQQSSIQSLNEHDDFDDLYNNRPASVRSSYSNFHGTRALNYSAKHYHGHATPQVPQKRGANPNRHSMRAVAFLNNGPPAYSSQGHASVDSETTI